MEAISDGWKKGTGRTGRTGESKGESGFTFVYVTRVLAPFLRLLPATAMMMMMSPVQPGLHPFPSFLKQETRIAWNVCEQINVHVPKRGLSMMVSTPEQDSPGSWPCPCCQWQQEQLEHGGHDFRN